jgi:hypothetical protein
MRRVGAKKNLKAHPQGMGIPLTVAEPIEFEVVGTVVVIL